MSTLFVSYSRKDIESARRLTGAFQEQGLDFWIDWEGIPPTVDWWQEIEKGIEEADIFLFLISPDSCKSSVCKREIEHAVQNGKRLIPIVVRDVKADEAHERLGHLNWIFLRESDEFSRSFEKLITAIHTDYEWVQVQRQLQLKALEWERSAQKSDFLLRGEELREAELQLAANSSKEPHPTDLQRDYVLRSRLARERQRRVVGGIAVGVIVALALLSVVALAQAGAARRAEATAVTNEGIAKTAEAQAAEKARIALSRQLAAQAQLLQAGGNPAKQDVAVLLAVRSMQLFPVIDSALILQNNLSAYPTTGVSHEDVVYSAAFSPDGSLVASASGDGTVRLWESSTGGEVTRLQHPNEVYAVAFSPDGRTLASSSRDGIARFWDLATGKEISRLTHLDEVYSADFSPDGSHVATRSYHAAAVWDLATGEAVFRLPDDAMVEAMAFSADGRQVLSISQDAVSIWDWNTGTEVSHLTFDEPWLPIALSPGGKYVALGSGSQISVREVATEREVSRVEQSAWFAAFSPDGTDLISYNSPTKSFRVWDVLSGRLVTLIQVEADRELASAVMSPDGTRVVLTDWQGSARVWEIPTRLEVARFMLDNIVMSVSLSEDGRSLLAGSEDGTARVWDVPTGNEMAALEYDGSRKSLTLSPDGGYAASIDAAQTVHIWNVLARKEVAGIKESGAVSAMTISPDSQYLVTAGEDHTIRVSRLDNGEETTRMTHDDAVTAIVMSLNGTYIGSVSDDLTIRVWELKSGKEVLRIATDSSDNLLALSHDGALLAEARGDTIRLWEVASGKELRRMVHGAEVKSIAFSPAG